VLTALRVVIINAIDENSPFVEEAKEHIEMLISLTKTLVDSRKL
jgi:hypothetical protein